MSRNTMEAVMYRFRYIYSILIKALTFLQILVKVPNIKYHKKSFQPFSSCSMRMDGQTDGRSEFNRRSAGFRMRLKIKEHKKGGDLRSINFKSVSVNRFKV
jgi:hypothetical protein